MQIQQTIREVTLRLKLLPHVQQSRLEAEILISYVAQIPRERLILSDHQKLDQNAIEKLEELIQRRVSGEPIAYLTQRKEFFGLEFFVNKNVLIPRPETEELIENVLLRLGDIKPELIFDWGVGSGCIGIALLRQFSESQLHGWDISAEAIEVAKHNSVCLGVDRRCVWHVQDPEIDFITSVNPLCMQQRADLIVSNPPYIANDCQWIEKNVVKFEPHLALYSSDNGLEIIKRWANLLSSALRPGGLFMFEIGFQQGDVLREFFQNIPELEHIHLIQDLSGKNRFVSGRRK